MADTVFVGTAPNDGTGDPLRQALTYINQKFVAVQAGMSEDAQDIVERVEAARDAAVSSAETAAAARDAAFVNAGAFTSTAAGLAGTSLNEYFVVVSPSGDSVQMYRHTAGPTATIVTGAVYPTTKNVGSILADASSNVAFGTESLGRWSGVGLSGAVGNTAIGYQAGGAITSGDRNVDAGFGAGRANSTGSDNVRVGYAAGLLAPSGNSNVEIGTSAAGNTSVAHSDIVAIGRVALNNVRSSEIVGIGSGAGTNLTTGVRFTAVGAGAGTGHTTEDGCTFVGWGAGSASGQVLGKANQTAIGHQAYCTWENQVALGDNQVQEMRMFGDVFMRRFAFADTVIGTRAGNRATTAGSGGRVIIGYDAGAASMGANDNLSVIIGYLACNQASQNRAYVAIGAKAGEYAQNTIDSTFVGDQAGRWLGRHQPLSWDASADETHIKSAGADVTQGLALPANIVGATGFGKNALRYNTIGANNTGFGDSALGFTTTGAANVAVGYVCGEGNVTGSRNTWAGQGIRVYQYSGDDNAQIGYGIGEGVGSFGTWVSGGSRNSNVGTQSLRLWRGNEVSSIGYRCFYNLVAGDGKDVGIGARAGQSVTTGGSNVFVGADAGNHASQLANVQGSTAIGAGAYTTRSNEVVIGKSTDTHVTLAGVEFTKSQLEALLALL